MPRQRVARSDVSTGVLVAMSDRWESSVVTALDRSGELVVVRRCADLADLLAAAGAGLAPLAVVSADLRFLDRTALDQLARHGVRVVGLHGPGEEEAERALRMLGVELVLPTDLPADELLGQLEAVGVAPGRPEHSAYPSGSAQDGGSQAEDVRLDRGPLATAATRPAGARTSERAPAAPARADVASDLSRDADAPTPSWRRRREPVSPARRARLSESTPTDGAEDRPSAEGAVAGEVLAVWGPAGAPGRTTVAVHLAAELAALGDTVLLVDADTYGGSVAQVLSLLDEAPGIAAATRAAEHGSLDLETLARLTPEVAPRLRVLTGLPKAERWPEVRTVALEQVLATTRRLARWTVIDCGFSLEQDEELSHDTTVPRRNGATLTSLASADRVLAVGAADPIGLQRLVRGLQELGTVPSPPPMVVVNKVRASAVGKDPQLRIAEALQRFAGVDDLRFLPADQPVVDAILLAGRSLAEGAPHSGLRQAFARLAAEISRGGTARVGRRGPAALRRLPGRSRPARR